MDPFWRDGNGPLRIPEATRLAMVKMKRLADNDVPNDLKKAHNDPDRVSQG